MVRFAIKKLSNVAAADKRISNKILQSSSVRRSITTNLRQGASLRQIQRKVGTLGQKISQKDLFAFIRTNYSDRTFNKWLSTVGSKSTVGSFSSTSLFEGVQEGVRIKGFVRGTDVNTGTKVFHTVDVVIARNTNMVKALAVIRENGLQRLNDSLQVELEQTGFLV